MDPWVWKTEIASNRSGTLGSGRRLASINQECSSWLQGVGKLQRGYQYLLIFTWILWCSGARKQIRKNKLIQNEESGTRHISAGP